MKRRSLLALSAAVAVSPALAQASPAPPKRYFALMHTPGPKWDPGKSFRDQPGIDRHVAYMDGYFGQHKLVIGGPFLDDSGGMSIFDVASLDEAQAIAHADPTVQGGLLNVAVKPWLAAFSRL